MATKITAIIIMAVFYASYLGKKYSQRRQGITTNQIGKGSKPRRVLLVETIMGWSTALVIPIEIASILLHPEFTITNILKNCLPLQWTGLVVAATGVAFFITAMLTMADSWRAGIPDSDKTAFVQKGIYSISRNPAFVGFDLMYIGLLIAFPNMVHLLFAIFPIVMLHLQVRQEEEFLRKTFGAEYDKYCRKVRRYI